MQKFVWELTKRGRWAPQLFHGDLPREMGTRENAGRYRVHDLSPEQYATAMQGYGAPGWTPFPYLTSQFPPPEPEPREILTVIETTHAQSRASDVD